MTRLARMERLLHAHTALLDEALRAGFTPERQAKLNAIEAEVETLAEAAEIAYYGAKLYPDPQHRTPQ